jgi:hypothetical protein
LTQRTPLSLAFSVKDSTDTLATGVVAADPQSGSLPSYQWLNVLDYATPWIDLNGNGTNDPADTQSVPANPEQDPVIVRKGNLMHAAQGPSGYFDSLSPLAIYLEADFSSAYTPGTFQTTLTLESFSQ